MNQAKEQKNFYSFLLLQDVRGLERLPTCFPLLTFLVRKRNANANLSSSSSSFFYFPSSGSFSDLVHVRWGILFPSLFLARKNWKSLKGGIAQFSFLVVSASRDGPEWIFMQSLGGGGRRLINGKNGEGRSICIRAGGECIPFSCKAPI